MRVKCRIHSPLRGGWVKNDRTNGLLQKWGSVPLLPQLLDVL